MDERSHFVSELQFSSPWMYSDTSSIKHNFPPKQTLHPLSNEKDNTTPGPPPGRRRIPKALKPPALSSGTGFLPPPKPSALKQTNLPSPPGLLKSTSEGEFPSPSPPLARTDGEVASTRSVAEDTVGLENDYRGDPALENKYQGLDWRTVYIAEDFDLKHACPEASCWRSTDTERNTGGTNTNESTRTQKEFEAKKYTRHFRSGSTSSVCGILDHVWQHNKSKPVPKPRARRCKTKLKRSIVRESPNESIYTITILTEHVGIQSGITMQRLSSGYVPRVKVRQSQFSPRSSLANVQQRRSDTVVSDGIVEDEDISRKPRIEKDLENRPRATDLGPPKGLVINEKHIETQACIESASPTLEGRDDAVQGLSQDDVPSEEATACMKGETGSQDLLVPVVEQVVIEQELDAQLELGHEEIVKLEGDGEIQEEIARSDGGTTPRIPEDDPNIYSQEQTERSDCLEAFAKARWLEIYDDATGYVYYENSATGESSWVAPSMYESMSGVTVFGDKRNVEQHSSQNEQLPDHSIQFEMVRQKNYTIEI